MDGTKRCSRHPFCDETADLVVPAPDGSDYPICEDCYDEPCGRCRSPIDEDSNVAKGLCQDCRDEIRMWSGDGDRGVQKDPESEQTTLLTDGGRSTSDIDRLDVDRIDELCEKAANHPEELTDEEIDEIKAHMQDVEETLDAFKDAIRPVARAMRDATSAFLEDMQPLVELAREHPDMTIDEDDGGDA